jgi:prepilin signal peptidase PulO-like enzyme (type II secretory pathway)
MDTIVIAVLGLLAGAVVNRLGTDLPARRRPQLPRCPYCGRTRPWYQWVALPTYVIGRARCPHCSADISIRYPLVEVVLAFLFPFLYLRYGATVQFGFFAAYTAIFALAAVTDLERRLILNVVTVPAMALAIIGSFFSGQITWWSALLGGLVGYIFFLVAALVGNALVGPGAMGGGDVKLAAFVGLVTGFPLVVEALLLTILSGGLVSLFLLVTRIRSLRDPIPYGPFLIVGGWVTMLWGMQIASWFLHR